MKSLNIPAVEVTLINSCKQTTPTPGLHVYDLLNEGVVVNEETFRDKHLHGHTHTHMLNGITEQVTEVGKKAILCSVVLRNVPQEKVFKRFNPAITGQQ